MLIVSPKDHPMATTPCPDRDQLLDYLLGKLPDDISDRIAAHLDECPTCESAAETLDQVSDTMVSELNRPLTRGQFESEPQYHEALQRVLALAGAESGTVGDSVRTLGDVSPGLGQLGEYRLLEKLGEGGMGAVYKAQHTKLDKLVALKVLPKDRMQNPMAVSRFEREMKAVGRLNHPHIVQAHDAREIDGTHFLAMEYVEGLDLAKLVSQTGPLRVADACELARQAAVGLQHAHEQGLVHRDIKPSNLMLSVVRGPLSVAPARVQRITHHGQLTTDHGQQTIVKILDLGLALLGTNEPNRPEMTAAGTAMGTADYVSPEQVTDSHSVDIRSDIYSLGCTLYKLLSGRAPFVGPEFKNDVAKMMAHVHSTPPPISLLRTDLPPGLAAVIERMMAGKPKDRFATPGEVATALEPFAVGCDLGRLLNEANGLVALPTIEPPCSASTGKLIASAHSDTATPAPLAPVRRQEDAPSAPLASVFRGDGPGVRGGSRRPLWIALAAAAAIPLLLAGWIIIRVRDEKGNVVSELKVPANQTVEIEQDGKPLAKFPADVRPAPDASTSRPSSSEPKVAPPAVVPSARHEGQPLATAGKMLSSVSAVLQPAMLPGLGAWTVETIGHRSGVQCLAVHPEGKKLATGGNDGTIRIWDVATGTLKRALIGHDTDVIRSIAWSADGSLLASAAGYASPGALAVWDAATGHRCIMLKDGRHPSCVAWSPKGATLAVGYDGEFVQLVTFDLSAPGLQPVGVLEARMPVVAWSPDGALIAGCLDGTSDPTGRVLIFDVATRKQVKSLAVDVGGPIDHQNVSFSPNGKLLALHGGRSNGVQIWEVASGNVVHRLERQHTYGLAWSANAKTVYVTSLDTLEWDLATGEAKRLDGLTHDGGTLSIALAANGASLITTGGYGDIRIRDMAAPNTIRTIEGHAASPWTPSSWLTNLLVSFPSPNGDLLAIQENTKDRFLVDTKAAAKKCDLSSYGKPITCWAWSPDSRFVAGATQEQVVVWDTGTGDLYGVLTAPGMAKTGLQSMLAWSPDCLSLAALLSDGSVVVWNVAAMEAAPPLKAPPGSDDSASPPPAPCLQFGWAATGRHIVAVYADGRLHLGCVAADEPMRELTTIKGQRVAWSPDGSELAVLHPTGNLQVWNLGTFGLAREAPTTDRFGVAWSPKGDLLATAGALESGGGQVHTWLSKELVQTRKFNGSERPFTLQLAFSGDGQSVVCVDDVWRVLQWEVDGSSEPKDRSPYANACDIQRDFSFARYPNLAQVWRINPRTPLLSILSTRRGHVVVSPDGKVSGSPEALDELVYVAETENGQETFTPAEFAQRFGWNSK